MNNSIQTILKDFKEQFMVKSPEYGKTVGFWKTDENGTYIRPEHVEQWLEHQLQTLERESNNDLGKLRGKYRDALIDLPNYKEINTRMFTAEAEFMIEKLPQEINPDKCPKCGTYLSIRNKKKGVGVDPFCSKCELSQKKESK